MITKLSFKITVFSLKIPVAGERVTSQENILKEAPHLNKK